MHSSGNMILLVTKSGPVSSVQGLICFQAMLQTGLTTDSSGHVHVTGRTAGALSGQTSSGSLDAFVRKYDSSGMEKWTRQFGSGTEEGASGNSISTDSDGSVFAAGMVRGALPGESAQAVLSYAFVAKLFEPVLSVTIDVKPGSFPNTVNLGSGGTVPVAIFSSQDFDARNVVPLSIRLASAPVKLRGNGTPMSSSEDVNSDGLMDLVVHVSTEALQLSDTDTEVVLEGETKEGKRIRGLDTIRVVP